MCGLFAFKPPTELEYAITKDAVQEEVTSFHLTDLSLWGSGGNPARNQKALALFVTKTDKNGARTLLTSTPNTTNPLTVSAWDVTISLDGLVEKILFVVDIWVSGTFATDDIIFYTVNSKFYKATQASTGQLPTNATYFVEVPQADLYANEVLNDCTTMEVDIQNDLIMGNTDLALAEEYQKVTDVFLNGKYEVNKLSKADYIDALVNGAEAALVAGRPYEAEEIVRGINNYILTI